MWVLFVCVKNHHLNKTFFHFCNIPAWMYQVLSLFGTDLGSKERRRPIHLAMLQVLRLRIPQNGHSGGNRMRCEVKSGNGDCEQVSRSSLQQSQVHSCLLCSARLHRKSRLQPPAPNRHSHGWGCLQHHQPRIPRRRSPSLGRSGWHRFPPSRTRLTGWGSVARQSGFSRHRQPIQW